MSPPYPREILPHSAGNVPEPYPPRRVKLLIFHLPLPSIRYFHRVMKPFFAKAVFLLLLVLLTAKTASAQRNLFFNLNVENGLLQSQARDLAQDKRGCLWIATLGGLSRYDGKDFRSYTVRDGMRSNAVIAVEAADDGSLWVGSTNGLSHFDGKTFRRYEMGKDAPVTRIKKGTDGKIWGIAGNTFFSVWKDKVFYPKLPLTNAQVTALFPAPDTTIWVAVVEGMLYHLVGKKTVAYALPTTVFVLAILTDAKGRLWLGTTDGLYTVENGAVVPARIGGKSFHHLPPVLCFAADHNGALWGGMQSGAFRLKDSTLTFFNKRNGFTDNTIQSLFTDVEGNVWAATDGQGIYRYSGTPFTALDESTGLPSAQVMAMATDRAGKLFLGTYESSLFLYEKGRVKPMNIPGKPPITAMRFVGKTLWLGTSNAGLWRYENNRFFAVSSAQTKLQSPLITALYPDTKGRLWIGGSNSVSYLQHDSFFAVPLTGTAIQDFTEIGADSILMATGNGLQLFTNGAVFPFKTNAAPDSATPQCLAVQGSALWIGTSENGLIYYNRQTQQTRVLNKNSGLQSDFVYSLITDDSGTIWAGTGYGINRIRYDGKSKPQIQFYGRAQGIAGMESNHNSVLKMPDGSLWFGTTNGALHYQSQHAAVQPKPVSVALHSVTVFGEPVTDTSWFKRKDTWYDVPYGLRLPFRKNNVTFTFGAVSLSGNDALHYRYRLAGLDAPWSDWATTTTITFSALPPGRYTLQVQCSVEGTERAIQELRYPFEIITPFHKTGLFRFLIVVGCILLGIAIQYLIHKQKRTREALIEKLRREEQAKVRERTAEDFHDEVGNKLTRINVLTNVLKRMISPGPDVERILLQIQDNTAQLYGGTRDILWSLKPSNDNLYEILHRIRDFGGELFGDTDVQFLFSGTDEGWQKYRLPLDVSRNLIMIFKEALNNALKYSGATEVKLDVSLHIDGVLHLLLTDNGNGFDVQEVKRGHGIGNMEVRAKRIGGSIQLTSQKGEGTRIHLRFPLPKE